MTDLPPPPPPPPPGYGLIPGYTAGPPALAVTSRGKRFGAYLLEGLLVVVTLIIGWIIWSIVLWGQGQTPAKKLLKMRVVKVETYRPASRGDMALRELVGKQLLGLVSCNITTLVGAIQVLASDDHRAVWDRLAGTVVVEDPNNYFNL